MPENKKLQVFLCYAKEDQSSARKLFNRLQKNGVDVWLDEENLLPGQLWKIEIPKQVRTTDVVIVLLSSNSIAKTGYVQKEIKIALDAADERPSNKIFLIPVRVEECVLPDEIAQYQWVDLFRKRGYSQLIRSLINQATSLGLQPPTPKQNTPKKTPKVAERIVYVDRTIPAEPEKKKNWMVENGFFHM